MKEVAVQVPHNLAKRERDSLGKRLLTKAPDGPVRYQVREQIGAAVVVTVPDDESLAEVTAKVKEAFNEIGRPDLKPGRAVALE